jgi:DNA-binding PadR family transcriptional regulator
MDELSKKILELLAHDGEHTTGEIYLALKDLVTDRGQIRYRLMTLGADGLVERRVVTSKVIMWRITDKGKETLKAQ